jgi:hypothetical protein
MDKAAEWKLASVRFPSPTLHQYKITPERIQQSVIRGAIEYATRKTASVSNNQYRELAAQYAIYKTAALCRFPEELQPFGVRLAVWQTLNPKFGIWGNK